MEMIETNVSIEQLMAHLIQLERERDHLSTELHMTQLLFRQMKHDRNRIARQLATTQRDLEHLKRSQATFKALGHHDYDSFRRRQKRYNRWISKQSLNGSSELIIGHKKSSKRKKKRKNNSINNGIVSNDYNCLPLPIRSSYRQFDTLNYPQMSTNDTIYENVSNVLNEHLQQQQQQHELLPSTSECKLRYNNSLRQCIEFSRSLLDLTKIDQNDNEISNQEKQLNISLINEEDQMIPIELNTEEECSKVRIIQLQNKPKDFLGIFFDTSLVDEVIVHKVITNSIADRSGIMPGDRLLEICGINVRKVNYRLANRIIEDCETDLIEFKLISSTSTTTTIDQASIVELNSNENVIKRKSTLTRRAAFKSKARLHSYLERKRSNESMLYQTSHLTVTLPRRIAINQPLAKIKLMGGNAVGIFVHSIGDDFLANLLQTGDQLLEYNNFDLTKATAEDAAIELAKPARNGILVAMFNMETYNQIQQRSMGDSFYIRTEFSRQSINKSLEFKKGDILYVDNTLYDGKPGFWRAWKVDERTGQRTMACGIIPSKYNAQCELLKQIQRSNQHNVSKNYNGKHSRQSSRWTRFRFILFWRSSLNKNKQTSHHQFYHHHRHNDQTTMTTMSNSRILASCRISYTQLSNDDDHENPNQIEEIIEHGFNDMETEDDDNAKSYQLVNMIPLRKPRLILLFGPFADLVAQRMEMEFAHQYRSLIIADSSKINQIIDDGRHPIITILNNNNLNIIEQYESNQWFPIMVSIHFRSPKHLKDTVNKWKMINQKTFNDNNNNYQLKGSNGVRRSSTIGFKMAKTFYNHMIDMEQRFNERNRRFHIRIVGNNLTFMCTQLKDRIDDEQNKVLWTEAKQLAKCDPVSE
ncbi:Disks large 5 [Blomia tropicalis]|nr:Disks large 5 [Blomia tropicalis]